MAEFAKGLDTAIPPTERGTIMSSNIRKIVTDAAGTVPTPYADRVEAVVTALEAAASSIADRLVAKGLTLGADEDDLKAIMVEVGLVSEPEPEPEAAADDTSGTDVSALLRRVEALEAAARSRGIRV
jgi:hypothetical protein